MNLEAHLVDLFVREFLAKHFALCIVCIQLIAIWRLWVRTRYLTELLHREHESALKRAAEIQTQLLRSFFNADEPKLHSLADDTSDDFTAKR